MRWDELFDDLADEWAAADRSAALAEVADRTRAEWARATLLARLRGAVDSVVSVDTPAGVVTGTLLRVSSDCLLLAESPGEALVPLPAVCGVAGIGSATVPDELVGVVERRLGLAAILRRIAQDRSPVTVYRRSAAALYGTPALAAADHLELAEHEPDQVPRARAVRRRVLVPYAQVALIRRTS